MKTEWPDRATHLIKCTDPEFKKEFFCTDTGDRYQHISSTAYLKKDMVGKSGWQVFDRPEKTAAEVNADARSDAIDKLADEIAEYHGLTGARVTHQELAMHLYKLNYRRFEILDDAP